MSTGDVRIYWKNTTADVIGPEHGLGPEELEPVGARCDEAVIELIKQREAGQLRFLDLPDDRQAAAEVQAACDLFAGQTTNLVVMGVGGSALGNIALQTALSSPMYNLLDADFVQLRFQPLHELVRRDRVHFTALRFIS